MRSEFVSVQTAHCIIQRLMFGSEGFDTIAEFFITSEMDIFGNSAATCDSIYPI
jgi:hypothetical protein